MPAYGASASVDAFYKAALAAGGRANGKPGLRPQYHPNYYGAFVLDPVRVNRKERCLTHEEIQCLSAAASGG
jgi:hypothetical protein